MKTVTKKKIMYVQNEIDLSSETTENILNQFKKSEWKGKLKKKTRNILNAASIIRVFLSHSRVTEFFKSERKPWLSVLQGEESDPQPHTTLTRRVFLTTQEWHVFTGHPRLTANWPQTSCRFFQYTVLAFQFFIHQIRLVLGMSRTSSFTHSICLDFIFMNH